MFISDIFFFFFFNDTATTEIYTLSLHDALPISSVPPRHGRTRARDRDRRHGGDRKSTRLNSSHTVISYAVFCLKKKKHKPDPLRSQKQSPCGRNHPRCHLTK